MEYHDHLTDLQEMRQWLTSSPMKDIEHKFEQKQKKKKKKIPKLWYILYLMDGAS